MNWLEKARVEMVRPISSDNFRGLLYLFYNKLWDNETSEFWGWNKLNKEEKRCLMGEIAEAGIPGIVKLAEVDNISELEAGFQKIDSFLEPKKGWHDSKEPISYLYAFWTYLDNVNPSLYKKFYEVKESQDGIACGQICLGPSMQHWNAEDHIQMRDKFWKVIKQFLRSNIECRP